jgi:hypothetical protein
LTHAQGSASLASARVERVQQFCPEKGYFYEFPPQRADQDFSHFPD